MFSSPEVLRYLNDPPVETREKAVELIGSFDETYHKRWGVDWGVTLHGDDQLIGHVGCYAWHRSNRRVDIGYHLMASHWGKGYATEAARAIIGWAFDNLDVHRIQADCTDGNIASERVMLKCGFRHEGTWRESCWEHGRFVNIKQFGLLRREFE
jgi:RimJ/RimL family protein N-acetyltransferase